MADPAASDLTLRTLCATCAGTGELDRHVARIRDGRILTGITVDKCWICDGEGWIRFARRG